MKGIRLEFYKLRRRKIWVIILVLLVVQCLWGSGHFGIWMQKSYLRVICSACTIFPC